MKFCVVHINHLNLDQSKKKRYNQLMILNFEKLFSNQ